KEWVVVVLGGAWDVSVKGGDHWASLGGGADVFGGGATSVSLPPGASVTVASTNGAELAVVKAPAEAGGEAYVIRPDEVRRETRGEGSWKRDVHTILDGSLPAHRLLVG